MLESVNVQCVALKSCWSVSVVCFSAANIIDCRPLEFIMAVWFWQWHQHGFNFPVLMIDTCFFSSIFLNKISYILSFRWLTSVMFNLGFYAHYHTLCTVFVLTVALTSPLCSLLAATMRRSFGSRGRCGLRVLASYSSEYRYTRTPVRKPRLGSALLLISPWALSSPPCSHTNTQASDTSAKTGSELKYMHK